MQHSANTVLKGNDCLPSSSSSLVVSSPQPEESAPQTGGFPVYGISEDTTINVKTFSITEREEGSLFGTVYYPSTENVLKPISSERAVISAQNQLTDPVAFAPHNADSPAYSEITTKLNLRHLSKCLPPNIPTTPHVLSPDIPTNQAVIRHSHPVPPSTNIINPLPGLILVSRSKPDITPSQSTPTFPPLRFPWAIHRDPSPTNSQTSGRISNSILPPRPLTIKVFGSRNSNQQGQTSFPGTGGVKRKAIGVGPVERPLKFTKVGENVKPGKETSFWTETSTSNSGTSSLGFPQHSFDQEEDNANNASDSDAERPAFMESSDGPGKSDDEPGVEHADKQQDSALSGRAHDKFRKSGEYPQTPNRLKKPVLPHMRSVSRLVVIGWVNELKRFQYLRDSGKMDANVTWGLHQLLTEINKQKDDPYLTPKILGDMQLGRLVSEFRHGKHGKASKVVADGIAKVWRHLCREVEFRD